MVTQAVAKCRGAGELVVAAINDVLRLEEEKIKSSRYPTLLQGQP